MSVRWAATTACAPFRGRQEQVSDIALKHHRPGSSRPSHHRGRVVLAAGSHLADLTRPGGDRGSGMRRVGVVLGLEGHHSGGIDLAAGRRGLGQALKYRSKPAGASTSTNRTTASLGLAKVWAIPWRISAKLPAGAVSRRCSTVNTTVPSRTYTA